MVASLLLVLGIVALATITLVAKKGRARPDVAKKGHARPDNKHNEKDQELDPWEEAGKRGGNDTDEPQ